MSFYFPVGVERDNDRKFEWTGSKEEWVSGIIRSKKRKL